MRSDKFLGPNVIMSGMHITGQIINYDEKREFQGRCVQHPRCAIYVNDAPKFDENTDRKIVEFIDKYATCSILHKDAKPELHESSIIGDVNKTVFLFFTKHILNLKHIKQ